MDAQVNERMIVEGRERGDREQMDPPVRFDGSALEHRAPAARVHREQLSAGVRRGANSPRDGLRNVVQLEISESTARQRHARR